MTPNIDALAAAGVLYTHAVCETPWTTASASALMTGRSALQHVVRIPTDRLDSRLPTLAEQFSGAGYQTAAFVSLFDLDHIFGLDRGFATYDDQFTEPVQPLGKRVFQMQSIFYGQPAEDRRMRERKQQNDSMKTDAEATDAALGWLRRHRAGKFFMWVHYFGGHERPQPGHMLAPQLAAYPIAIENTDAEIGRLLRWFVDANLYQSTVIVLHGSQGQELLDRGGFGHGGNLSEAAIRVPLLISGPKTGAYGQRVERLVSLLDVAPTLLELAGVRGRGRLDGQSLLRPALVKSNEAQAVYLETWLPATLLANLAAGNGIAPGFVYRGWREARWKYLRREPVALLDHPDPEPVPPFASVVEELYDLAADPREAVNLAGREPERLAQMRQSLLQWVANQTASHTVALRSAK